MKTIFLSLLLSMVTILSAEAHKHNKHNNARVTISIQTFYDELSPYGDWVYTSDYGYVWRPYFEYPDAFRPYSSNGYWVNTEFGWTWVSDYHWGWATFHYGRWAFDNYLGWMWVPGYEWAPAWVTWGNYGDYYGWAPMGPNIYVSVNSNWYAPDPWWTFVPRRHFCSPHWNNYIYDRPVQVTNITYITNVYNNNNYNSHNSWYYGPRVSDVERYSRTKVRRVEVVDSQRADNTGIRNERLNVYRPEVNNNRKDARPTEYRHAEQLKSERRIQTTNARTNDPGVNRTRESRNSTAITGTRANTSTKESRSEQGSTQASNTRNRVSETVKDARTNSRTIAQPTDNGRNGQAEVRNMPSTERRNASALPAKNERAATRQYENTTSPSRENAKSTLPRETERSKNNSTASTREQKAKSTPEAIRPKPENTDRKQAVKEEVRQASSRIKSPGNEKNTSANPSRR